MKHVTDVGKALLVSYLVTIGMLLACACIMLQSGLQEEQMKPVIYGVYALSNFAGGFVLGKIKKNRKFIWGLISGVAYCVVLGILSFAINGSVFENPGHTISAVLFSIFFGMFGGMVS